MLWNNFKKSVLILFSALLFVSCGEKTSENQKFKTLSDFEGKKIATSIGSTHAEALVEKYNSVKVSYANSSPDLLMLLETSKVDAITVTDAFSANVLKEKPNFRLFPEPYGNSESGFIFKKGSPLKKIFDEVLQKMKDSGQLQEIIEKWNGDDENLKVVPEQTWEGKNGTYNYYTEAFYEPFSYLKDEEVVGIDIDVLLNIAKELDIKLNIFNVDFIAVLPAVQGGKGDIGGGGLSITEERAKTVDFSIPYYIEEYVFMYKDDSDSQRENFFTSLQNSFHRNFITENRWKLILNGFIVSIFISVASLILGLLIGFLICLLRRSNNKLGNKFAFLFIKIMQGMPIVVFLMILYYVVFAKVNISGILVSIIGFGLNFAAYSCEIMRSGLDSIETGQTEAALALGYTKMQSFWKVVFPQAAQRFIPVLKGQFISMVKETSIVGYIAVQDLTKVSDIIRSRTLEAFFPLISTAIIYFVMANLLTMFLTKFEASIDPKRRKNVLKGVKK